VAEQLLGGAGRIHVGAGDMDAPGLQNQSQGAHADAADAHQMDMVAGLKVFSQLFVSNNHKEVSSVYVAITKTLYSILPPLTTGILSEKSGVFREI
jgi:hypothetical protein